MFVRRTKSVQRIIRVGETNGTVSLFNRLRPGRRLIYASAARCIRNEMDAMRMANENGPFMNGPILGWILHSGKLRRPHAPGERLGTARSTRFARRPLDGSARSTDQRRWEIT